MNLKNRIVLVTGGGGIGVGAGVCKALSKFGATVILNEIDMEKAEQAAKKYPGAIPVAADISQPEEIANMFEKVTAEVGVIDGLVNNAGVGLSKMAHEVSEEEFDRLYDIDIKGVWQVSKAFVNGLLAHKKPGSIVNISSVNAHSTMSRYAIYASAKAAVEGLTRGMAVELGPYNIRVNAVGPGYVHAEQNYDLIKTWTDDPEQWVKDFIIDQQALNFDILPEDCGNTVAFLISELSRAVTGQTLYVDNGSTSLLFNRFSTEKFNL
ncbi:SDR family oxidoreductase [Fulvivirgaceae bacterium BMA10]|uniref:SDR family oxidoreductase n=1 Tax=Splendidivirga corallicola TaxID=3051826 RepID=A0ABT8KHV8_9BACT|nr:SDR family oxidoreductase [Fulvivirgaceae bacterium BMA10]